MAGKTKNVIAEETTAVEETTVEAAPKTAYVRLPLLKGNNARQEEFFSVNYKNYIIKRGKKVEVPLELAEAIENGQIAEDAAVEYAQAKAVRKPE